MEVELICSCHKKVLMFTALDKCEWTFKNDKRCDPVEGPLFDWECDPRKDYCKEGQYKMRRLTESTIMTTPLTTTSTETIQIGLRHLETTQASQPNPTSVTIHKFPQENGITSLYNLMN